MTRTIIRRGQLLLVVAALLTANPCLSEGENETESLAGAAWEEVHVGEGQRMEDLLHWAVVNSDPGALEAQAKEARHPAHGSDFAERQARITQLLRAVEEQPTEADLILEAIAILGNATEPQQAQRDALEALAVLVEPLDNANDLHKLGGLAPVVSLLASPAARLRAGAALVLGTAASNNEPFQHTLMAHHPEAVPALMRLVNTAAAAGTGRAPSGGGSDGGSGGAAGQQPQGQEERRAAAEAEANAALYALAAILRTHLPARAVFYAGAGMQGLEALLADPAAPLRLRRKALNLIADLIHLDAGSGATHAGLDHGAAVGAILALLAPPGGQQGGGGSGVPGAGEEDLDLQEKAVLALLAVLEHHGGAMDAATLERTREALGGLAGRLRAGLAAEGGGSQDDDEDLFAQDVLAVVAQAQQRVEVQQAARRRAAEL